MSGHTDVVDLLASEFGARIGVDCLTGAARWGHDAMIDHLVEEYGVDPNGADRLGLTALHKAARCGRVRTVKHLVEKHNVDIHKRTLRSGETALDRAEEYGMTECAAVLRETCISADPQVAEASACTTLACCANAPAFFACTDKHAVLAICDITLVNVLRD